MKLVFFMVAATLLSSEAFSISANANYKTMLPIKRYFSNPYYMSGLINLDVSIYGDGLSLQLQKASFTVPCSYSMRKGLFKPRKQYIAMPIEPDDAQDKYEYLTMDLFYELVENNYSFLNYKPVVNLENRFKLEYHFDNTDDETHTLQRGRFRNHDKTVKEFMDEVLTVALFDYGAPLPITYYSGRSRFNDHECELESRTSRTIGIYGVDLNKLENSDGYYESLGKDKYKTIHEFWTKSGIYRAEFEFGFAYIRETYLKYATHPRMITVYQFTPQKFMIYKKGSDIPVLEGTNFRNDKKVNIFFSGE